MSREGFDAVWAGESRASPSASTTLKAPRQPTAAASALPGLHSLPGDTLLGEPTFLYFLPTQEFQGG